MLNIKCFSFNPICVNTYVVYNESKDCVIIDAGNCNLREDNVLFDFIEKNQLKPIMILNRLDEIKLKFQLDFCVC